jgi:hypothetical protein
MQTIESVCTIKIIISVFMEVGLAQYGLDGLKV